VQIAKRRWSNISVIDHIPILVVSFSQENIIFLVVWPCQIPLRLW